LLSWTGTCDVTFDYPELTTVTHDGRWYLTPSGVYYPSITTILGHTAPPEKVASLENWRRGVGYDEADRITQAAADHGTNVHLLVERHLKGEQVDAPIDGAPVPELDLAAFKALKLKLRNITEVWGQEVPVYSDELEVAGRLDLVGRYKGVPAIVDFKTSRRVKNDEDIHSYKLQLCFYAHAHNERYGTSIELGVILMVAQTGFPLEFHISLPEHLEELKARVRAYWAEALKAHK
jgi:hypothetical protein